MRPNLDGGALGEDGADQGTNPRPTSAAAPDQPSAAAQAAEGASGPRAGKAPLLPDRHSLRGQMDLRRTRARELARLLPLLGAVLFFLPLLGSNARATGPTGLWLFSCWAGLILVAALLSPGLKRDLDPERDRPRDGK